MAYGEIGKLLKSLKSFKMNEKEVEKCKHRLVSLITLLDKLEETIERSNMVAIDINLDLLNHKLNAILRDSDYNEDDFNHLDVDKRHDETALYLEDILLRCKSSSLPRMDSFRKSKSHELTKVMLNSQEFIMNFIHEIVWPEILKRLDQKKKRKQLMVDLENLTIEEKSRSVTL